MVFKEPLNLSDLVRALTFCIYERTKIVIITKYKNFMLATS